MLLLLLLIVIVIVRYQVEQYTSIYFGIANGNDNTIDIGKYTSYIIFSNNRINQQLLKYS